MRSAGRCLAALVLIALPLMLGCAKEKAGESEPVARVGSKTITKADMQARMDEMPPFMKQQLATPDGQKRLMDALIEEEMIYRDALAMGLDKSDEFKKEIERSKRDLLIRQYYETVVEAKSTPTDEEIQEYYGANPKEFTVAENVTARHILVKTRDEALKLRRQIEEGKDFAELAGASSLDASSKAAGGMIGGPIMRGGAVKGLGALPEFVDAAFALKEGETSQPVKTAKGFHIIRVEKRTPETVKSLEEAKNDIVSKVQYSKRRNMRDEILNQLKSKYKVSYVTEGGDRQAGTPEELFKKASEAATPQEKIGYYEQFVEKYPKNERAYEAKFMIGFTLAEELKDYDAAEKVFKEFLRAYPESDLSDDATWMMENMRSGAQPDLGGE